LFDTSTEKKFGNLGSECAQNGFKREKASHKCTLGMNLAPISPSVFFFNAESIFYCLLA
jgi:hypothetical protein